jgi:aminotransferase
MTRFGRRTSGFTESVIRGMSTLAREHNAINLAQGFPDFPAPQELKDAAARAIASDVNQYAITWGSRRLREALARKYDEWYGMRVDPETDITVTCGSTEAMVASLMALLEPGDEVIVFDPFYENYGPDAILAGASLRHLPLAPGAQLDLDLLARAFSPKTRAIILNSPANPSGKVFSRVELEAIAALCQRHDAWAVTDEIYEHIRYDVTHIPIGSLPGMAERTITISGASKTFAVTGWRIGWAIAPPAITGAIRKVHDFLTVGAPAPLMEAIADALERLGAGFYHQIARDYRTRRDLLHEVLLSAGFTAELPQGAYYMLADYSAISDLPDPEFARWLTREVGVTPVPGSSFFSQPDPARRIVRFAFCKREETLREAAVRLARLTEVRIA